MLSLSMDVLISRELQRANSHLRVGRKTPLSIPARITTDRH